MKPDKANGRSRLDRSLRRLLLSLTALCVDTSHVNQSVVYVVTPLLHLVEAANKHARVNLAF